MIKKFYKKYFQRKRDLIKKYSFLLTEGYPELRTEDGAKGNSERRVINWICSNPLRGSGGQTDVLRLATFLEENGYQCKLFFDTDKDRDKVTSVVKANYPRFSGNIRIGHRAFPPSTAVIATSWYTAYIAHQIKNTKEKFYFVQDYEPYFSPMGAPYKFRAATYELGLKVITLGRWLAKKLRTEFGVKAEHIDFGYDRAEYYPVSERETQESKKFYSIAAYFQPQKPRRGAELIILALYLLYRKLDARLEIILHGSDSHNIKIPFPHKSLGLGLTSSKLRNLYNNVDLGLSCSFGNMSLLPFEMMASKCMVVEMNLPTVKDYLQDGYNCALSDPDPKDLAKTIEHYLHSKDERRRIIENAYNFVTQYSWEKSASQFMDILEGQLNTDV